MSIAKYKPDVEHGGNKHRNPSFPSPQTIYTHMNHMNVRRRCFRMSAYASSMCVQVPAPPNMNRVVVAALILGSVCRIVGTEVETHLT